MRKATKQRNILVALALAFVAVIAALFSVFMPKSERLEASAAATYENENLKFAHNGAYIRLDSTGTYSLRYKLTVNEQIFSNGDLFITFYDYYQSGQLQTFYTKSEAQEDVAKAKYGAYFFGSVGDTTLDGKTAAPFILKYQKSDLEFDENGSITLNVGIHADRPTKSVQLVACMGTLNGLLNKSNTDLAISDARSYKEVVVNGYLAGDPQLSNHPFVEGFANFTYGDMEQFRISPQMDLNSKDGLQMTINLPTDLMEELIKDEVETNLLWTLGHQQWEWTKKYLVITQATSLDNYTSGTNQELATGEGYKQYWYTLGGSADRCAVSATRLYIDSSIIQIKLPSYPSDYDSTYYYYAQIVERDVKTTSTLFGGITLTKQESNNIINRTAPTEYTYENSFTGASKTVTENGYVMTSMKSVAEGILTADLIDDDNELAWLMDIAGTQVDQGSLLPVTVKYKKVVEDSRTVVDAIGTISVKPTKAYSKNLVQSTLYSSFQGDKQYTNLADFNAVVENNYWKLNTDGTAKVYYMAPQILVQAIGTSYTFNSSTGKGELVVEYTPFYYKDFALRIVNNDPDNPLVMDVYASDVSVSSGNVTITFNYNDIQEYLYNSCRWLFQLKPENLTVTGDTKAICHKGTSALTITVPEEQQDLLMNLNVTAVAEILPDVEYSVTYEYAQLSLDENNDIVTETIASEPFTVLYSELVGEYNFENFYVNNATNKAAIDVALNTVPGYMTPKAIRSLIGDNLSGDYTAIIQVMYNYRTPIKILSSINGVDTFVGYAVAQEGTLMYFGDDFLSSLPTGYRVSAVTSDSANVSKIKNDEEDYTNTSIELYSAISEETTVLTYTLTDKWHLVINRMETYVNLAGVTTPFCTKKTDNVELSYSDYPDMTALTATDIAHILGLADRQALKICNIALPYEDIEVVFDDVSTYTATLEYGKSTVKALNTAGQSKTVEVPLTSFTVWAKAFWEYNTSPNVLMLNTKKNTWFAAGEARNETIYGYFATATFDLQMSSINDWFYNRTADGCVTFFDKREVKGNDLYEFFASQIGNGILNTGLSAVGMMFCEVFDDDNKTVETNFFYLDGTNTTDPYLSIGGADSSDDKDTALENAGQDVVDNIQNWWVSLNQDTGIETIFKVVLAIVGIIGVAAICFWMLNKAGVFKTVAEASAKRTGARKSPATKNKVAMSGPKRGTKDGK